MSIDPIGRRRAGRADWSEAMVRDHVEFSAAALEHVRRRLAATRWPTRELDASQGVQLATTEALVDYWSTEYDFGRLAARLNALPQFTTEIDGLDIHFIHVRAARENALPLLIRLGDR